MTTRNLGAVLLMLVTVPACSGSVTPTGPSSTTVSSTPPGPVNVPTLPASARTYAFSAPLEYSVRSYTEASQFVLFEDGKFQLNYPHVAYAGTYTQTNGTVTFSWEGWSTAGPWAATGVLTENTLTIRYNIIMLLSDFEDAVYTLK